MRLGPQRYLYGTGSLSLVWQLGSGSVRFASSGRNVRRSVLDSDLRALCNKILKLLEIPRPMSPQNTTDQREFNIKQISYLMHGLYIIYRVQADDLRRKLKDLLDQCRRRYFGETSPIDLPGVDVNRQAQITMDGNGAQNIDDNFGEAFIEFGFGEPGSPRTRFQDPPIRHASPVLEQSFEAGEQVDDVMSILRKTKKVQRVQRRRTKKHGDNVGDLENDTALLTLLKTNVADPQDITMIEVSIPQGHPNEVENVRFDDDFARDFNNQSTIPDVGAEDMSSMIQQHQQREPSLELLPRQEQTPYRPTQMSDSFRLDLIVRGNENVRTPDEAAVVVGPSRKRRRTQRLDNNNEVKLSMQEMQDNMNAGVFSEPEIREILDDLLAPHPKLKINFPLNIRPVRFIERLQTFHGRKLKVQVLQEMVNKIQSGQLNLDGEVMRQNLEDRTSNNGDFTTFVPNSAMDDIPQSPVIDIHRTMNTRSHNEISEVQEIPLPETTEGEVRSMAHETEVQNDNMDFMVIPSPPRESFPEENFPIQSPIQGKNLDFAQTGFLQDGRLFSDMFPPASTTKSKAALQFHHLLKLQKEKKVMITQTIFLGAMRITSLNPTV